ncbi:ribonucleotide-diphosphate reductase subunit alpha [Peribacillus asahii]|uniref:Ribonucleotide-diphosphate reductase subunit alpha n=1 Tax=Peribacillus asahii TaxID=228899 RepID=A0A3Q9RNY6_9BACI|nr:ribonucleotide-diphosphate reductase subunit alpha [Peribacillus asahii]
MQELSIAQTFVMKSLKTQAKQLLQKLTLTMEKLSSLKEAGDFVVCNLSSIHLGNAVPDNVLERLISIQV